MNMAVGIIIRSWVSFFILTGSFAAVKQEGAKEQCGHQKLPCSRLEQSEKFCRSTLEPVSYTHLDVYKRQPSYKVMNIAHVFTFVAIKVCFPNVNL